MPAQSQLNISNQKLSNSEIIYSPKVVAQPNSLDISDESSGEEENAIVEIDQISVLGASKTSLKRRPSKFSKEYENLLKSGDKIIPNITAEEQKKINEKNRKCQSFYSFRGIGLALFSSLLTSIVIITMKMAFLYTPAEQLILRNAVQVIIMFIIAKYQKKNILGPKKYRKLLWLRGFMTTVTLMCAFFAISFVNPSDQAAIVQSSIILTALFGRIFLKEKITIVHVFAVGLTVSGVFLISQPSFLFSRLKSIDHEVAKNLSTFLNSFNCSITDQSTACNKTVINFNEKSSNKMYSSNLYFVGIALALCDAISRSSSQVVLKKLVVKKVHYTVPATYTSFTGLPIAIILSAILILSGYSKIFENYQNRFDELKVQTVMVLIIGFVGTLNQLTMNLALKYDDVLKISLVKSADLFFVLLSQTIFLDIRINTLNLVGVMIIFISTTLILTFKYLDERVVNAPVKQSSELGERSEENAIKKRSIFIRALFFKF